MRVTEPIVKNGFFFAPSDPGKRYPGILRILDGGRIELHLTSDENAFVSFDEMFIGRLIGKIEGGYTTLEGCSYETMNLSLGGGASTSLITARIAYIGLGMAEERLFDQLEFAVDELSEWYGKSAFKPTMGMKASDCVIDFAMPSTVTCRLQESVVLEIGMKATFPGRVNYPVTELRQQACLTIKADLSKPLTFFTSLSHKITRFLALCIGHPVAIHSLRVSLKEEEEELPCWQEVYFQSLNSGTTAKKKRGRTMLLPYSQMGEQFGAMIQAWLGEYDTLMPALHHYFAVQDEGLAYNDTKFLAIAQALEAFHRRTLPGYRWSKAEFTKKLAGIVEAVPEAEREWVKQRLCFANELTLGERLTELLEPYADVFGGQATVSLMVKNTKNTRNYHAHYDEKGERKALKGAALVALVLRLQVLFTLCLLGRLGMPLALALSLVKQPNLARLLGNANHLLAEE
jgi:hypothetical protein